jgi:hypothetical protein
MVDKRTYLEQKVDLVANEAKEVFFNEFDPTLISIENMGTGKIYAYTKSNVSVDLFDIEILPGEKKTICKPQGQRYIYLLSVGDGTNYGWGTAMIISAEGQINPDNLEGIKDVKVVPQEFRPVKITLTANNSFLVKTKPGYVASISTALTDLLVGNGYEAGEVWKGNYGGGVPMYFNQDIRLISATGGVVYVVYK